jgi:hypothetical protein
LKAFGPVVRLLTAPPRFDDCLKLGRRISEGPYTLPNPEILNVRAGAIPAPRIIPQVRNATNPEPSSEPQPPSSAEYHEPARAIKAFKDKKVKFGEDLNLNDRLKGVIGELIRAGGGDVTDSLEAAYIYVCNYRDGADYVEASQKKKYVGNLSWLYYMITHDTWTDPMRRMLHYPRPRNGIPGFEKYKISISSYTGEARVYLENLVKASGAEFTKTFKQDNTHLITAHKQSEKCEAAEEWGVHVVNHLWLEESYARCKEQPLSRSQYVYFPGRTNLGEVIGQTEIDPDAVEKNYFSKNRKPTLTKGESGASTASAKRSAAKPTNEQNAQASTPLASKHTRTKRAAEATTPLPPSRIDGKENETPGTTGSRGAKNRALSKLHEAAPDIAKFEQEMKRKGGVVYGGRRDKEAEVADKKKKGRESTPSKRSIDEVDNDGESSADDAAGEAGQRAKKAKKEKLPPAKHRMVITKFDRWLNDPDKESRDKAALRELGIQIVADATKNVDLLCAPNIVRTEKFISALACGPTVVSTSYLEYALKNHKLPPAEKHLLQDKNYEQQHGFKLQEALERARQNKKRLLRDWTIFCTDDVPGGYDTFKGIITANGGTCQKWAGRPTGIRAVKRTIDESVGDISQNQEEDEGDVLYLISSDKPKNPSLWKKFRELAEKNDMVPRIVTTQWILFVVMAQYIHCDPQWELGEKTMKAKK